MTVSATAIEPGHGRVQFAFLASGSRGNAALVRGEGLGLLIDAGLGPRALGDRLASVGAGWNAIGAVVLTHTHGDHVDSATFMQLARLGIVVHCHEGHRGALGDNPGFQSLERAGLVSCYQEDRPILTRAGIRIEPIAVSHDGGPTFGFRIEVSPGRRTRPVALGYLSDSGCWTDRIAESLADVDAMGIEFNHDEQMQRTSGRPWVLVRRNLGDRGHLSNDQGAELVEAIVRRSRPGSLKHLVLLHLSEQCNDPSLAIAAARGALRGLGRRVAVHAARQDPAHPNLWIRPGRPTARIRPERKAGATVSSWPSPVLAGLFDETGAP